MKFKTLITNTQNTNEAEGAIRLPYAVRNI